MWKLWLAASHSLVSEVFQGRECEGRGKSRGVIRLRAGVRGSWELEAGSCW